MLEQYSINKRLFICTVLCTMLSKLKTLSHSSAKTTALCMPGQWLAMPLFKETLHTCAHNYRLNL